jgi:hypothetical protein
MELLQARPRRRGQTLRGLIRVNLAFIEQEVECGINFATVRAELGLSRVAPAAFRDALYNVRRKLRAFHPPVAATPRPLAPTRKPAVAPQSPATPPSAPAGFSPKHESLQVPRPKPRSGWGSNVRSPRDFLDLVRSTDDSEIL